MTETATLDPADLAVKLETSEYGGTEMDVAILRLFGFEVRSSSHRTKKLFGYGDETRWHVETAPALNEQQVYQFTWDVQPVTTLFDRALALYRAMPFFDGYRFTLESGDFATVRMFAPDGRTTGEATAKLERMAFCAAMVRAKLAAS